MSDHAPEGADAAGTNIVPTSGPSDDAPVRLHTDRGIAFVVLNTPGNRNALSARMVAALRGHLAAAGADPRLRAVVLTHTGPTFSSGADLTEAARGGMRDGSRSLVELLRTVVELPLPVVAVLHGNARAGGLGLVAAADVAIAASQATFAFPEARLGLAPAVISLACLPRLDSRAASRYMLTGESFDAAEAQRIGLLTAIGDEVVADGILDALRGCSRQGLVESKRITSAATRREFDEDARLGGRVAEVSARLFDSAEAAEGMAAAREHRAPRWAE